MTNGTSCWPQRDENGYCDNDYDCKNNLGCLNNRCVKYFSLENNYDLVTEPKSVYSFCKSGEYDPKFKKCITSTNIDDLFKECNKQNQCNYLNSDGGKVSNLGSCRCALGNTGKSYCNLGSGIILIDYLLNVYNWLIFD